MTETEFIQFIVTPFITAILTVVSGIIYYEYKHRKEEKRKRRREKITKLLLPLYIAVHIEHESTLEYFRNGTTELSFEEYESSKPKNLFVAVNKIIRENIFLADESLHTACLNFIIWADGFDVHERYQQMMSAANNGKFLLDDENYINFYNTVIEKYNTERSLYSNT